MFVESLSYCVACYLSDCLANQPMTNLSPSISPILMVLRLQTTRQLTVWKPFLIIILRWWSISDLQSKIKFCPFVRRFSIQMNGWLIHTHYYWASVLWSRACWHPAEGRCSEVLHSWLQLLRVNEIQCSWICTWRIHVRNNALSVLTSPISTVMVKMPPGQLVPAPYWDHL